MSTVRIVSWNIAQRDECWRQLAADSSVDVALLQEAKAPPADVSLEVFGAEDGWVTAGWKRRAFRTAIVKCSDRVRVENSLAVRPLPEAGRDELGVSRPGSIALAKVMPPDGKPFTVASVYAAWENPVPLADGGWIYADASAHRLVSDLSALVASQRGHRILVSGDWNILHGYGEHGSPYWAARYQSVFDRLEAIGLRFIGPQQPNGLAAEPAPSELPRDSRDVPTFRTNEADPASAQRQLDFVFASDDLARHVTRVAAMNGEQEWGGSDHCRVVTEITLVEM